MAEYDSIITVEVTANATPQTQEGFGTPIFLSPSRTKAERVLSFTSLTEVSTEFGANSVETTAATAFFSQTPDPSIIKFGRREAKWVADPNTPETGDVYGITVTINATPYPFVIAPTLITDTEEDVVEALIALIANDAVIGGLAAQPLIEAINGSSGSFSFLEINGVPDGTTGIIPFFTVTTAQTVLPAAWDTQSYVAVGTAEETMTSVIETDDDFFFVTSNDKDSTFVRELSAIVQGLNKMYFVSGDEAAALQNTVTDTTSIPTLLFNATIKATHTVYLFHNDPTSFPECAYVAANAVYDAGSVTWANLQIGVSASKDPATGKLLTTTQKINLLAKNANFIEREAGLDFTRIGITSGGEWIDIIRGSFWLSAEISTALRGLLVYQKGGKVTYDDQGIARVRNVISSALQRGVNRNFLTSFTLSVPLAGTVSSVDKMNRVLKNVTFVGDLAGAIHAVEVQGSLIV